MKKDFKNKNESENIVLDEESLKDEKKKPTVKKILGAVLLILLAVVFAVLGFCVVGGAFDGNTKCNVAFADSSDVDVYDLQSQAFSDYTLPNISSYTSLYGVFFNKSFNITYQDCVAHSSYFQKYGSNSFSCGLSLTASNGFYSQSFDFEPVFFDNELLSGMGAQGTLTAPMYALSCLYRSNGDSMGDGFIYLIYNDIADYNLLMSTPAGSVLPFGVSIIPFFDFSDTFREPDVTYDSSFKGYNHNMSSEMLAYWSNFMFLSLPSIGSSGVSQADYDRVVSERDNAISEYNDYKSLLESQFSYVPEVYINPTNSTKHDRVFIDKDTILGVFVVNANKSISDIIDSNGNLILSINGLNDSSDSSSVWQRLFALQGYQGFVSICNIAHLTPKDSAITPKGMICSYDIKNKRLTVWRNVVSFADVDLQTTYSAFAESYQDYGTSVTQADRKATTEGIISVLESPVNFLKTVFNFEIFGINISAVVFFVVSIVIVAFVIKKVV